MPNYSLRSRLSTLRGRLSRSPHRADKDPIGATWSQSPCRRLRDLAAIHLNLELLYQAICVAGPQMLGRDCVVHPSAFLVIQDMHEIITVALVSLSLLLYQHESFSSSHSTLQEAVPAFGQYHINSEDTRNHNNFNGPIPFPTSAQPQ